MKLSENSKNAGLMIISLQSDATHYSKNPEVDISTYLSP
jgi:hypothetical protein